MRLVPRRWAGATITGLTKIGAALEAPRGQQIGLRTTRILCQAICAGGNVEYHPVPPATARRRIWIVYGDSITLGTGRRPGPIKRRRDVAPLATEPIKYLLLVDAAGGFDVRATDNKISRERLARA